MCGLEEQNEGMMIKCLISRDILPVYEAVMERGQNWEDRLRDAFKKPASLISDFLEIYNYEKASDSAPIFFEKVDKLVDKIMRHKWEKNELVAYFLVHCVKDNNTRREIKMRDATKVDQIKDVIKKLDSINNEVFDVAVIQRKETFANVVRKRENFENTQHNRQSRSNQYQGPKDEQYFNGQHKQQQRGLYNQLPREKQVQFRRVINCWNCQEQGHMARECPHRKILACHNCGINGHISRDCQKNNQYRQIRCFSCKEEGHSRGECPNVTCSKCRGRGHFAHQCYKSQERFYDQSGGRPHNRSYAMRKQENHNLAVIASEDEQMRASSRCAIDDDGDDVISTDYPNSRAPTPGEMLGAMH